MLTLTEDLDFEIIKQAVEQQYTKAVMNRATEEDVDRIAKLSHRLNQARGIYINEGYVHDTSRSNGN